MARDPLRTRRHLLGVLQEDAPQGPVLRVLRRRRDLRAGLVQLGYVAAALVAGLVLPTISRGGMAHRRAVSQLLFGLAGGLISFIALVFSLLFLVIQNGNTSLSPRYTLFRDARVVWHAFGYYAAVLVYCCAAGLRIGVEDGDVTIFVPIVAVVMVVVALGLSRTLQLRALKALQFNDSMEEIRRRGAELLTSLYRSPFADGEPARPQLPPVVAELRWERATTMLVQIDLPHLIDAAAVLDVVVAVEVMISTELRRGATVVTVRADRELATREIEQVGQLLDTFTTGIDRKFVQDPLLAFRLLTDIGNRAMSAAINDPETCVHALGCSYDLLATIADRRLDFGVIVDRHGKPRVGLHLPAWEDFVAAAVDEISFYGGGQPTVAHRIEMLLTDLLALAPPERHPALVERLTALHARRRTPFASHIELPVADHPHTGDDAAGALRCDGPPPADPNWSDQP